MRRLTIVPYAGLCNRLDSIGSALLYHKYNPDDFIEILWFKCNHCNCRYSDLFEPLDRDYPNVQELNSFIKKRPGTRQNLFSPKFLRPLWYDIEIGPQHVSDQFEKYVEGKERIYIYKDNRFCKYSINESLGDVFKPVQDIQYKISEQINSWEGNCIGLHIRRTDNQDAINGSPNSHFYDIIDREIENDKNTVFYLATDDPSVKQELVNKYGEKIHYSNLTLKRNTVEGMKHTVIDLWCLANTDRIYGSKSSTYSLFASKIFNKPLFI